MTNMALRGVLEMEYPITLYEEKHDGAAVQ